MTLRVLDLFSGIGGFSLGLERAGGFETVAFCEYDAKCREVLKKHWPTVPQFNDIRELAGDAVGPVDVITGGYPCQPFSQAGKRRGAEDDRHLWPEMHRLVAELRPSWVIGENVAGHISMGLDQVLSDLESEGYTCRPFVIPACAVDAPHRRDRVWIVANDDSQQRSADKRKPDTQPDGGDNARGIRANVPYTNSQRGNRGATEHRTDGGSEPAGISAVANANGCGPSGSGRPIHASYSAAKGNREVNRTFHACRWATEPDVGRVAARLSAWLDHNRGVTLDGQAEALARAEGVTTDIARLGCLRALREYGELTETPSRLQRSDAVRYRLSDVSRQVARRGAAGEPYEAMRDLWDQVSSIPYEETQNLFKEVFERVGQEECKKALGQRASRLKQLGNSVVPQIPEMIGRAILEAS